MGRALRGCDNLRVLPHLRSLEVVEDACRFAAVTTNADVAKASWTCSSRRRWHATAGAKSEDHATAPFKNLR
jgi:hypothetical protein